jgi:hypothetical protein
VVIVRTNPPPRPAVVALTQRVGRLVVLNLATAGAFTSDIVACRWACSATRASPSSSSLDGIAPAALLERRGEGQPEVVVDPQMLTHIEQVSPLHPQRYRQDA